MSAKYVIDSSAWIEYFRGSSKGLKISEIIEQKTIGTSLIAIAELADKYEREKLNFEKRLSFIQKRATVLQVSIFLCFAAAKLKQRFRKTKPKFSLADGFHLATALDENAILVTADKDFSETEDVLLI